MGSKPSFGTVDDSVHVMLQHDKKLARKKGKTEPRRDIIMFFVHLLIAFFVLSKKVSQLLATYLERNIHCYRTRKRNLW
jgi:hypothetical protein